MKRLRSEGVEKVKSKVSSTHNVKLSRIDTPLGIITVDYCETGIHGITWGTTDGDPRDISESSPMKETQDSNEAVNWLRSYFGHETNRISVKDPQHYPKICWTSLKLTDFSRDVLLGALNHIKYGQTVSYSELAKMIGHQGASRAVGTALKNNPIPILIPCHRIVRANGAYGNYSGGKRNQMKEWLIQYEKNDL